MFTTYISEIVNNPQKIIHFNLDGIFGLYLSLSQNQRDILSHSLRKILNSLDNDSKKRLYLVIPETARREMGI